MAIEAELADGTVLEFPDGTPQGVIQAAVKRMVLGAPSVQPQATQKRGLIGRGLDVLRESAESILEPAATIASGAVAMPVAGAAMLAGDIYSGITGGPRIGDDVAADVMKAMTYQPRSRAGQSNLESIGQAFQASKLPVAPQVTGGLTGAALSRLAGPAAKQAGSIAAEEAAIAAQMLPDVGGKMQSGAQKLMLSALKPTTKQYASGAAELAAKELLRRDIGPNLKGVTAINQRIAELQGEISAAIKDSPATIRKQAVIDRLASVRDRFMRTANPESDLAAIAAAEEGFAAHPLIPGEILPVQLAQDIKQGTYSELRKKYGELGSAQTESQKALARGLKEEVASKVPEVAPLNAEESALLKTLDVVERRQFLEMNKDPIPLTGALRNPAAWAAITADKSTAFKSLVARLLYKTGKAIKGETPQPAAVSPAPTLSLAPLGEPLIPPSPQGPMPQGRGMLSLADDVPAGKREFQMPSVDMPIEPRLNPMYQRGGIPQESGLSLTPKGELLRMPEVPYPSPLEGRGLLGLADDTQIQRASPQVESVNFRTRLDVMNTPVMKKAVASFIDEAESIKSAISTETNGFKRSALEARLRGVENRFMAGLKQMGIRNESEARNLMRKVYETGGETQRGIEKVFTPMRAGAQQ